MNPAQNLEQAQAHFETAEAFCRKFQNEKALSYYESVKEYYKTQEMWQDYLIIVNKLSQCHSRIKQLSISTAYAQHILNFTAEKQLPYYEMIASAYSMLAYNCEFAKEDLDIALDYTAEGLKVAQKHLEEDHLMIERLNFQYGSIYARKQDYGQALAYFQKCLPSALKRGRYYPLAVTYFRIAECLRDLQRCEESLQYYQYGLDCHTAEALEQNRYIPSIFSSMGICYTYLGNKEKALEYCLKGVEKSIHHVGEINYITGHCYEILAEYYWAFNEPKTALYYYEKVHKINNEIHPPFSTQVLLITHHLGQCHHRLKNHQKAVFYSQKALAKLLKNEQFTNPYQTLPIVQHENNDDLLEVLIGKARHLIGLFRQTQEYQDLIAAWQTAQWATQIVRAIRQSYKDEISKLHLAKDNIRLSHLMLEMLHQIQKTQQNTYQNNSEQLSSPIWEELQLVSISTSAFDVIEQNNSILLLSDFKNKHAQISGNIPQKLLQEEQTLRKKLAQLETKILQQESKTNSNSTPQLIEEKAQFARLKLQYTQLVQQFETDYPQYYQLKHQIETIPLQSLQKKLPLNTALVEYFIGEKQIYIFVITSNDTQFLQSPKPSDFDELIEAFKTSIDEIDKTEYTELAFELYQLLIAPILEYPISNNQYRIANLKIIPSGILSTIPFEALLTQEVTANAKYADLPYLLLQYDISYHYSATLWSQSQVEHSAHSQKNEQNESSFIGFAPVYKSEQAPKLEEAVTRGIYNKETTRSIRIGAETFSELIYSEEEVNTIQSYFQNQKIPTQTFLHAQANTSNFLQNVGKHKYVLISAHGFYNEKQPDLTGIILSPDVAKNLPTGAENSPTPVGFGDVRSGQVSPNFTSVGEPSLNNEPSSIFYLSDAYNLELNADLVVLSCCETGVGKLAKGEGVMALNRGFFYAGAKNVIYTLFKVYDQASCQLTQHLFLQILKSKPYSLALKEAKHQLILEGKAPIHWAGYLLIGE